MDWDQFNQLYYSDQIKKDVKNQDAIVYKMKVIL